MLTVRCSGRSEGGVCLGGVCLEGVCPGGIYTNPHMYREFLTHACENFTFPQLRLRTVTSRLVHVNKFPPLKRESLL